MNAITQKNELADNKDYQVILKNVKKLWENGIIQRGQGYSLSMSDALRSLLLREGIKCRLIECKLTVLNKNSSNLILVGHDGISKANKDSDFHIVCVTETPTPILIDLCSCKFDLQVPYIITKVGTVDGYLAEFAHYEGDTTWLYQEKTNSSLPQIYQQSIIDRFTTDRKIFSGLRTLTVLVILALTISTLNAIRGFYMFHHEYIVGEDGKVEIEHKLLPEDKK